MTEIIKDGTGRSFLLKIDEENRAMVLSDNRPEIGHVSWSHADAYSIGLSDYLTLSNTDWHLALSLKNNSQTENIVIQYLQISWNGGNTTGNKVLWVRDSGGYTITGGYNSTFIQNLNFTSANIANAVSYVWDGSTSGGIVKTGGTGIGAYAITQGRYQLNLFNSVVLGTNDYAGLEVKGEEIGNFCLGGVFYFKDKNAT